MGVWFGFPSCLGIVGDSNLLIMTSTNRGGCTIFPSLWETTFGVVGLLAHILGFVYQHRR